jgi:WD40 repeat protein
MEPKYRYPGVDYFKENDADIFCGRKRDTERLTSLLFLNGTVVLHGESGVGKSSLVQAGLIPKVKGWKIKYTPVTIRFEGDKKLAQQDDNVSERPENVLILEVIAELKAQFPNHNPLLPIINNKPDNLWLWLKSLELRGHFIVLIFDQFEQFQTYTPTQVNKFNEALAEVFRDEIPVDVYQEAQQKLIDEFKLETASKELNEVYVDEFNKLEQSLKTKALFVVREDKLGTMSLLSDYFPDILKNDYYLNLLDEANARRAILEPAKLSNDKGKYKSDFLFEEGAEANLISSLKKDSKTGLFDPLQIQIVCRDIERNVVIKKRKKIIREDDIPDLKNVIQDFYWNAWKKIEGQFSNKDEFEKKRKSFIEELIINGKRNLVHQDNLRKEKSDEKILKDLVNEGVLRKIPQGNEDFYQLTHDRLLKPLADDISELETKEKFVIGQEKRRKSRVRIQLIGLAIFVTLSLLGSYILSSKRANQMEEQLYWTTAKIFSRKNPTMGYKIALEWYEKSKYSNAFGAFVKRYDSMNYTLMSKLIPTNSEIVNAYLKNEDESVQVFTQDRIQTSSKIGLMENETLIQDGKILKVVDVSKKKIAIIQSKDSIKVRTLESQRISVFPFEGDVRIVDVSPDSRYILLNNELYDLISAKKIGELEEFDRTKDEMAAVFLNDNKHIAVGYWSGDIIIFRIEKTGKFLTPVKWFVSPRMNIAISSLIVDKTDSVLYAADRSAQINVWKVGRLLDSYSIDNVSKNAIYVPIKTLKGHSDNINCLALSNDGKLLISGSDDQTALIWNANTGVKISSLKGKEANVSFVSFSEDGKSIITGTVTGDLLIWSREPASQLAKTNRLAQFSPYDYYDIGLNQFNVRKVYDASSVTKLFASTLHYLASMPINNKDPEDLDHLKTLRKSIAEVDSLYQKLINHSYFKDSISLVNKKLLVKRYNEFALFNVPELLLQTVNETKAKTYEKFAIYHKKNRSLLLLDTAEISDAVKSAKAFISIAVYYRSNKVKQYEKSNYYLNFAVKEVLVPYLKKFPKHFELTEQAITVYGDLCTSYIYSNKPDSALLIANHIKTIRGGAGIANWGLIRAYLFTNHYDSALNIFKRNEFKKVRTNGSESLKEYLENSLENMKKLKVNNKNVDRFVEYLKTRKEPKQIN